jgi:hypothetical protein
MDELACKYVGSFGLLKSCDKRSPKPISDSGEMNPEWYANAKENDVLHVCPQALRSFISDVLPTLKKSFILVTNNSDMTIPEDVPNVLVLILHPLLTHWFAQNCTSTYHKITRIPIGMDYHSLTPSPGQFTWSHKQAHSWGVKKMPTVQESDLFAIKNLAGTRLCKAYANFQFLMTTRYGQIDRRDAIQTVPKELVMYEYIKTTRDICWKNMIKCKFVLSPHGNGLDCHRTWEALALGCYPIVKTSGLDPLFDDLPVWIVKEWSDITAETMRQTASDFDCREFKMEKLTLKYWQEVIENAK